MASKGLKPPWRPVQDRGLAHAAVTPEPSHAMACRHRYISSIHSVQAARWARAQETGSFSSAKLKINPPVPGSPQAGGIQKAAARTAQDRCYTSSYSRLCVSLPTGIASWPITYCAWAPAFPWRDTFYPDLTPSLFTCPFLIYTQQDTQLLHSGLGR